MKKYHPFLLPADNTLKRSIATKEFFIVFFSILALASFPFFNSESIYYSSIGICVLANALILSRTLFKKNRGLYKTNFLSGEFLAYCAETAWVVFVMWRFALNFKIAIPLIVSNGVVFSLCRGIAKSMTTRTQMIYR